jgi:hypothetical protein
VAEDWNAIAAEVEEAIASVGFAATLIRRVANPGPEWKPPSYTTTEYSVIVIDDNIQTRNADGTLTGESRRVLTMAALGTTPQKDDRVVVRGTVHVVLNVMPTAPGGVDLLFDVEIGGPDGPAP